MDGMNPIDEAAHYLTDLRRARRRGDRIPEAYRPADIETALAIQDRVSELLAEAIGGWKCSVPKPGRFLLGPIYASTIHRTSECPILPRDGVALIEPEIAFLIGDDGGIAATHLVIELLGSRYEHHGEVTFPEALADGFNGQGLLIGPKIDRPNGDWMSAFPISIPGVFEGEGRHPDGHPLNPLRWLQGYRPPRPGQIVTTGSYAGVIKAPMNTPLQIRFGDISEIGVTFVPAA
jgi:2-keto-4-pentenoate hydratase